MIRPILKGIERADLFKLRDPLREILAWRINTRKTSAFERFEAIHSKILLEIEQESKQSDISSDAAKLIERSIEAAFETVGIPLAVPA